MVQTVGVSALSVAANATSAEQLSGTLLETAPGNGVIMVSAKASATGLNMSMSAQGSLAVNDQVIPYTGTAGTLSITDNQFVSFPVLAGDRIQLRFRNTTGGAITVDAIVKFVDA